MWFGFIFFWNVKFFGIFRIVSVVSGIWYWKLLKSVIGIIFCYGEFVCVWVVSLIYNFFFLFWFGFGRGFLVIGMILDGVIIMEFLYS